MVIFSAYSGADVAEHIGGLRVGALLRFEIFRFFVPLLQIVIFVSFLSFSADFSATLLDLSIDYQLIRSLKKKIWKLWWTIFFRFRQSSRLVSVCFVLL